MSDRRDNIAIYDALVDQGAIPDILSRRDYWREPLRVMGTSKCVVVAPPQAGTSTILDLAAYCSAMGDGEAGTGTWTWAAVVGLMAKDPLSWLSNIRHGNFCRVGQSAVLHLSWHSDHLDAYPLDRVFVDDAHAITGERIAALGRRMEASRIGSLTLAGHDGPGVAAAWEASTRCQWDGTGWTPANPEGRYPGFRIPRSLAPLKERV